MPNRKLGRRKPLDRPVLRLGHYLTGAVPTHPDRVDYLTGATYGMYGNDKFGVCGPTEIANSRRQVTYWLTGTEVDPTQDDVFDLYRRSGNPDFDPDTDADDNGVEMKTMLSQVVKGGIGGVKAVAFAAVDVGNLDEVRAAIAIFGGLHLGVDLEVAQQSQTDAGGPWDYKRSGEWGGHAIYGGAYTSQTGRGVADLEIVSWEQLLGVTDAFWAHQVEEAYVVIWPEHLGTKAFLDGVDRTALAADYKALTGKDFPSGPAPTPTPAPTPKDNPLAELAALIRQAEGSVENAIKTVKDWLVKHGL